MIYIYSVRNTVNGKGYIGQTRNTRARWRSHKIAKSIVGTAIRKYGAEKFAFEPGYIISEGGRGE